MARGPKPNPDLDRYREFGYRPAVYLIEAGNTIKVGRAYSIATRLTRLHTELRHKGHAIGRIEVFPQRTCNELHRIESRLIRRLAAVAKNVVRTREYFTGISFDAALGVVRAAMPIAGGPLSVGTAHRPITPYGVARRFCLSA